LLTVAHFSLSEFSLLKQFLKRKFLACKTNEMTSGTLLLTEVIGQVRQDVNVNDISAVPAV